MQINLNVPLPDWPIVRRLLERVYPGINGQLDRWGRVTRSRTWGGISADVTGEVIEHERSGS